MENVKSQGEVGGLIAGLCYPVVPTGKIESDLKRNKTACSSASNRNLLSNGFKIRILISTE